MSRVGVTGGIDRGEEHGRRVGKGPAIVVTEVVQVKDDRDVSQPRPPHQLQAGGMTPVGQQHVGPKPLQNLVGQVEKRSRFSHVERTLLLSVLYCLAQRVVSGQLNCLAVPWDQSQILEQTARGRRI
jgi:hypothetical protein